MKSFFKNSVYELDTHTRIWSRPGYSSISYNDGDEIESRIANIIEQATDTTVFSTELSKNCTDWPSQYHLSGSRANILRPFAALLTGDILEIGAGCGAITRYLGECGANVLALEGSTRRAAITRSRTSDLENVIVLAEKFDTFQSNHKFDVITLIGVLEYANLFTPAENPALAMLKRAYSLLKPDGKLIIAIENQFGLKYFAGATEDHLGQPMYGIEGRYRNDQPQTFGRKVLVDVLEQAGFVSLELLAPFPDYKFPVSILTEKGIKNQDFNSAALVWQNVRYDRQLPPYCNFSLELAWPDVFKNGMAMDLANSFLVIASPKSQKFSDSDVEILAYHYTTDRVSQYCKETRFEVSDHKDIHVAYKRLGGAPQHNSHSGEDKVIEFVCPVSYRYIYSKGELMSRELIQIVTHDEWTIEEIGGFIQRYISILEYFLDQVGLNISITSSDVRLPGNFIDAIPQNIIITTTGPPVLIDKEWSLLDDVELGYLLFRGLLYSLESVTKFGENPMCGMYSYLDFIQSAFAVIGFTLTDKDLFRYIDVESRVQKQVSGLSIFSESYVACLLHRTLPKHNLAQALSERETQIAKLNQVLSELMNSTSWRITLPLRVFAQLTKRIIHVVKRAVFVGTFEG